MPTKLSSPPFQVAASISMSGTSVFISSVTGILYRDSLCYQFAWTGIPTGAFDIQGSVDYNAGLPQSGFPVNGGGGTWTSITLSPAPTSNGSGGATNILINMSQLSFPYIRAQYTNSTGSGFLGVWTSAKSFG